MFGRRNGTLEAKKLFDKLDDVRPGAHHGLDLHLAGPGDILEHFQVKRVRCGYGEFALADLYGQHQVVFGKGDGYGRGDHIQIQLQGVNFDKGNCPSFLQGFEKSYPHRAFSTDRLCASGSGDDGINKTKGLVPDFIKSAGWPVWSDVAQPV
jgi:hypothetical protein